MQIQLRLFAAARTALDKESVDVDVPVGSTIADLRRQIVAMHPALEPILAHSRIALNQDYAAEDTKIPDGAEVALIPPVSGG